MSQEISDAWKAVFSPGWKAADYFRGPVVTPEPVPYKIPTNHPTSSPVQEAALCDEKELASVMKLATEEPVGPSIPVEDGKVKQVLPETIAIGQVAPITTKEHLVRQDLENKETIATTTVESAVADDVITVFEEMKALCVSLHQLMTEAPDPNPIFSQARTASGHLTRTTVPPSVELS